MLGRCVDRRASGGEWHVLVDCHRLFEAIREEFLPVGVDAFGLAVKGCLHAGTQRWGLQDGADVSSGLLEFLLDEVIPVVLAHELAIVQEEILIRNFATLIFAFMRTPLRTAFATSLRGTSSSSSGFSCASIQAIIPSSVRADTSDRPSNSPSSTRPASSEGCTDDFRETGLAVLPAFL